MTDSSDYHAQYRQQSLAKYGPVCARCCREFAGKKMKLLTVHHKDGNHNNNPADGSNWENLCLDCHDHEHSKDALYSYLAQGENGRTAAPATRKNTPGTFTMLAEAFKGIVIDDPEAK